MSDEARLSRRDRKAERRRETQCAKPKLDRTQLPPKAPIEARAMFPDGYPIAVLEGERKPTRNEVKRAIAMRCAWLIKKIELRARLLQPTDFMFVELAALAVLVEVFEGSAYR